MIGCVVVPDQERAVLFATERSSETQAGERTEVQEPLSASAFVEPAEEGSWRAIIQPV